MECFIILTNLLIVARFRKDGIDNLRAMDLDSFTYMEPALHRADEIALTHLEPLFSNADGTSTYDYASRAAVSIEELAEKIEARGITDDNQEAYNSILNDLHMSQVQVHERISAWFVLGW